MSTYFIVRTPDLTEAQLRSILIYSVQKWTHANRAEVEVTDISAQESYIAQIDRLYNGPDDEVDYEEADEIRTSVGDDLYDAFSDLVPHAWGHAS
jgi:hypothetical protein